MLPQISVDGCWHVGVGVDAVDVEVLVLVLVSLFEVAEDVVLLDVVVDARQKQAVSETTRT